MVLSACSTGGGRPAQPDPANTSPPATKGGEVTWIVDGDTIEVETADETLQVRLRAINAPEQDECFAEPSLDHLIDTLKGRSVRLEVVGHDQFDRTLAHVFDGDRHVNRELVAMGLALASTPDDDDPYGSAILDAENMAFDSRLGLWSTTACGSEGPLPEVVIDISRSLFDPEGADEENLTEERVTILNHGAKDVDLTDWMIRDESTRHRFTFPPTRAVRLEPGQRLAIASSDSGWDPGGRPVWNNDGDVVLLQMPDGTIVDRQRY